jgi:hypothetical protein
MVASAFVTAPSFSQFAEDFETHLAAASGMPNAGQNGWYVPAVASSLDGSAYTYSGNLLGLPTHPGGGANFAGGTNTGGVFSTRMEHAFGIPPYAGTWSAEFDVCVDYLGQTFPAVNNIGSFSLQPSTTSRHFIALATWGAPIPSAGPPTTWTLDWLFFAGPTGATQVQASIGNASLGYPIGGAGLPSCFKNLRLKQWYRVKVWWDWTTNCLVRIGIRDLTVGWQGFVTLPMSGVPDWCLFGGMNNVGAAADPTGVRFFIGGSTAGNTAGYDNLVVIPDGVPAAINEYQVNQPGIATADLNGVQGTATCPALTFSSYIAGTLLVLSMDAGAQYDLAFNVGPAIPANDPLAITLPDGQIFNLNLASTLWLCPGGPAPCLVGPQSIPFIAPFPGFVVTGQVVAFGVGPLGVSLSQPFTLIAEL